MSLSDKIIENRQKRNLMQVREQLRGSKLADSIVGQIYYPKSSDLLKNALRNIHENLCQKESYISPSPECEERLTRHLATLSGSEKTVLCFFPNYSPQTNGIVSDLPILEVLGDTLVEWHKLAKDQGLHFFLCVSNDLRKGVALDFFEADPIVHQTAGSICDLYYWNT